MAESSPQQHLNRMLAGAWVTQALYVAAKLRLADLVGERPRTADDLASATHTQPRALYRLLRTLASVGVFREDDRRSFWLTPTAECLRSDVPGSQRAMALRAGELFWPVWAELASSVETGRPAFEKVHGLPLFEFLSRNPEQARLFDETMAGMHGRETAAMLDAYDFSGIRVLADVGGGNGSVLTAVLPRYPGVQGVLFDLPGVVERAKAGLRAAGLTDRCRAIGGDFFASIPGGADALLLRHILHDWDDDKATRILRNANRALDREGKLLVVESVLPAGNDPSFGKLLDLAMLAIPGGQERTEDEYRGLFETAGFRLTRVVPTGAEVCVLEGEKL